MRAKRCPSLLGSVLLLAALAALSPASAFQPAALANSDNGRFHPLALNHNDFNHCAVGFGFGASQVTFGGVPFSVDPATDPGALTVGTSTLNCAASPLSNGEITVDGRGGTLWLIGAADNDPPFPNTLFGVTIDYTDGTRTQADVHEIHSGLPGFIEFSSWGVNGRPDLAVYSTAATRRFERRLSLSV
jgi:hypothetical protein